MRPGRRPQGVTLIELVVAIAIVGILAAIAVPSYTSYRLRVDRSSGKECLLRVQDRMETFRTRTTRYTDDLADLGFGGLVGGALVCNAEGLYQVTIAAPTAACPLVNCYQLVAQPQGKQVKDGQMTLTHRPNEVDPNDRTVRLRDNNGVLVPWDH